jgi:hypothetical protein
VNRVTINLDEKLTRACVNGMHAGGPRAHTSHLSAKRCFPGKKPARSQEWQKEVFAKIARHDKRQLVGARRFTAAIGGRKPALVSTGFTRTQRTVIFNDDYTYKTIRARGIEPVVRALSSRESTPTRNRSPESVAMWGANGGGNAREK